MQPPMRLAYATVLAILVAGSVGGAEEPDLEELEAERTYERQRAVAHARMPDTMYASTPSPAMPPHAVTVAGTTPRTDRHSPWRIPSGWSQSDEEDTATDVFAEHISSIVQDKCVNCHVEGGASGHTRLVFVKDSDDDHLALNQRQFEDFVADVDDGADVILNKIRGVGHGGGIQVSLGSDDYGHMERFLTLLGGDTSGVELTPESLFDSVGFESDRKTLYRAALVFQGRVPTADEYASINDTGLRAAVRGLMTGPGFHEFLIRASNDRLLTDRNIGDLINPSIGGPFVGFTNNWSHRCEIRQASNLVAEDPDWDSLVQYGVRRAPLELIAHVVENDLPYTEILTADYVMANPWSAVAYGSDTGFEDSGDPHEFKPAEFTSYYLWDATRLSETTAECGAYITYPGDLRLDYPHAGILNTPVFLQRYPTTATNRNRARARWTYYHFLGLDVEKSASRTTDPDALADTDNPTLKNPACTACHVDLDPVAGAFQNYSDIGNYRASYGGADSLDGQYKTNLVNSEDFLIEARTWEERETVSVRVPLAAGDRRVGLTTVPSGNTYFTYAIAVDQVTIRNEDGGLVSRHNAVRDLENHACGRVVNGHLHLDYRCMSTIAIDIPRDGDYLIEVEAWDIEGNNVGNNNHPERLRVAAGDLYRPGDTWYRGMRDPGFAGDRSPDAANSVQWLAEKIVADERFAQAAVKFWWPAILGADVILPPEQADDADFEGRLLAANAQQNEVVRLASLFRGGIAGGPPYNLKDLLVEIVLSNWFRTASVDDDNPVRSVALRDAGGNRLLTPEELAAKTLSLTGVQWGRRDAQRSLTAEPHALTLEYAILYGGIDSDGIIERARALTSIMLSVARAHAAELACPVVLREFYLLPDDERRLFGDLDKTVTPESAGGEAAIHNKLVELHGKLFGEQVGAQSPEVFRTYELLVDVWNRKRTSSWTRFFDGSECRWSTDAGYFDDIPDDALNTLDLSDPEHIVRTWTVVLAAMLMDPRYLHL